VFGGVHGLPYAFDPDSLYFSSSDRSRPWPMGNNAASPPMKIVIAIFQGQNNPDGQCRPPQSIVRQ